jgi:hypothetical protein
MADGFGMQRGCSRPAVSGELGGLSQASSSSSSLSAGAAAKQRFSFVPVTDIRTPAVGLVNTFCRAMADTRVLVRFELTSLPPGCQSVQAAKVRSSRHGPPPDLTQSYTAETLRQRSTASRGSDTPGCPEQSLSRLQAQQQRPPPSMESACTATYLASRAGCRKGAQDSSNRRSDGQSRTSLPKLGAKAPACALAPITSGKETRGADVPRPAEPAGAGFMGRGDRPRAHASELPRPAHGLGQGRHGAPRRLETTRFGAEGGGLDLDAVPVCSTPPISPSVHLSPPSSPPPSPPHETPPGSPTKRAVQLPANGGPERSQGAGAFHRVAVPLDESSDTSRSFSRQSRYSLAPGARSMPRNRARAITQAVQCTPSKVAEERPRIWRLSSAAWRAGRHRCSAPIGGGMFNEADAPDSTPDAPAPLAWPVDRGWPQGKLRIAWTLNFALVISGLLWLGVMLRAYDVDDGHNLDAFWEIYVLALTQGLLISDTVKVLVITFISPPFWARILKPGTRRATIMRVLIRMPLSAVLRI